jgi:glycosyltransferase involved in cell wall biosynthesis
MSHDVTVLMPVGPNYNEEWLKEAVDSIYAQTIPVSSIQIVLDGRFKFSIWNYINPCDYRDQFHHINWTGDSRYIGKDTNIPTVWVYRIPANVGFVAAFNIGMSLAREDLVIYLASDDKLMPNAVELALNTYTAHSGLDAWYAFSYVDSDGKEGMIPINAAMITKKLWYGVGGYPPAAFVGPDAAVLSCLIKHAPERIIPIEPGTPLYWIRNHDQQETKTHTWRFVDEMNSIRNKLTEDFKWKD